MAGEHIEDLRINLINLDNAAVETQYNFLPIGKSTIELE